MKFTERQQLLIMKYRNDEQNPTIQITQGPTELAIMACSRSGSDCLKKYSFPSGGDHARLSVKAHSEARVFAEEIGCPVVR